MKALNGVLTECPKASSLLAQAARVSLSLHRPHTAKMYATRAQRLSPLSTPYSILVGTSAAYALDLDSAVTTLQSQAASDPDNASLSSLLLPLRKIQRALTAREASKDKRERSRLLEKQLRQAERDTIPEPVSLYFRALLAESYADFKQYDKAVEHATIVRSRVNVLRAECEVEGEETNGGGEIADVLDKIETAALQALLVAYVPGTKNDDPEDIDTDSMRALINRLKAVNPGHPSLRGHEEAHRKLEVAKQRPDYYKALGVSKTADKKQIRKAYHKLARDLHPDSVANQTATEEEKEKNHKRFTKVADAWDILSDDEKRKRYDNGEWVGDGEPPGGHQGGGGFGGQHFFHQSGGAGGFPGGGFPGGFQFVFR
ncbi:hypothetical protein KIPB_009531 [Kipferlia bialata]|uniref:J domain-containing protein n=1 Tax=Kipferlia bialata TaxID=797122 RepID=A0A9K3D3T4_9EUKA|nr:hypothetical protein KIPB_009531 [Kipferlia bialata]|eukprot:g9531.t1